MGKFKFTPEQRHVIDARNCTTLVSAAAGSGKTAVLVQRIIEKLTDPETPQDINRLLVVTYTQAAAAEMRERIGKRLNECLESGEYAGNEHLQKQVLLLRNASITTIHSFCLGVVREFFYELEMDPAFRVAEDAELKLLRADVMEELLEDYYTEGREPFLRLTECIGTGKTDADLERYIEKLYEFAQSAPFPERWLQEAREVLERQKQREFPSEEERYVKAAVAQIKMILSDCEKLCQRAITISSEQDGYEPYLTALEADKELLSEMLGKNSYRELAQIFSGLSFERLSTKKFQASEEKKAQTKKLRDTYKAMMVKLKADYFFAPPEQLAEDMAAMAPLLQVLVELCREYGERYARKKAEKGIADFGDLEHLAVRLLVEETENGVRPTEIARLLRGRFDEIMIDECQDSNEIQDLLLWSISGEEDGRPNRFMVGDVKQSIYKFRMAKPELFMEKYETYKEYNPGEPYCKIVLGKNFRSRASVIEVVNDIFGYLMQKNFGGIAYDDAAKLYLGADYPWDKEEESENGRKYTAELLLTELETEEDEEEETDRIMREAMTVGARIQDMITKELPIYDGEETDADGTKRKKFHPVTYGDIMILFRSMKGCAEEFVEVFTELGIPAVVEKKTGYFDAREVAVVLNALRIIDNPLQDIPLVSVLRSEMVGLTEEELAIVDIVAKEGRKEKRASFYEAIVKFLCVSADEETAERPVPAEEKQTLQSAREKLLRFEAWTETLRKMTSYAGVPELLETLYEQTKYPDFVRVKPAGDRRTENLSMLVEKAKKFEEGSYSGIFDFIRYIERLQKYDMEEGEAQLVAGENAVRIMSIHKSKGLEAPVVFVAGLSKKFNDKDYTAGLVLHPELGIGVEFRDEELRVKAPTFPKKVIAGKLKYEMLSEELRVLYVALTRAKEKLILSAAVPTAEEFYKELPNGEEQRARADYTELLKAVTYLDFLKGAFAYCLEKGSLCPVEPEQSKEQAEKAVGKKEAERQERKKRFFALSHTDMTTVFDENLAKELEERSAYRYPYPQYKGKMKLSVSELKKAAYADETQEELFPETEPEKIIPKFMQENKAEKISGSERGTLYHRIMECIDFTEEYPHETAVLAQMQALIEKGRIRNDAAELVAPGKILRFFESDLGKRMQQAAKKGMLKKEQPFVIGIPYREVYQDTETPNETELVMVQGIMDAYFEEDGELVLMDYKTDFVSGNVKEELTKRYAAQLRYYKQALGRITGKNVKECIIYAFTNGEAFVVE